MARRCCLWRKTLKVCVCVCWFSVSITWYFPSQFPDTSYAPWSPPLPGLRQYGSAVYVLAVRDEEGGAHSGAYIVTSDDVPLTFLQGFKELQAHCPLHPRYKATHIHTYTHSFTHTRVQHVILQKHTVSFLLCISVSFVFLPLWYLRQLLYLLCYILSVDLLIASLSGHSTQLYPFSLLKLRKFMTTNSSSSSSSSSSKSPDAGPGFTVFFWGLGNSATQHHLPPSMGSGNTGKFVHPL